MSELDRILRLEAQLAKSERARAHAEAELAAYARRASDLNRDVGRDLDQILRLEARLKRAIRAREEAEALLERKSQELFETNQQLREVNERLEEAIKIRTRDLEAALLASERAVKTKSEFLATMSHEIRTPMNGILGTIELLIETDLRDDQRILAETAARASQQLIGLLNDLLDLAKLESSEAAREPKPLSLAELIVNVTEIFQAQAALKSIDLGYKLDLPGDAWVMGDAAGLRRILLNLISNAVKYTESGTVLVHAYRTPDGRLALSVSDTGPGIPASVQGRLFQDFAQIGGVKAGEGSGLGLAITHRLVTSMGGTIVLESDRDAGATFTVRLDCPSIADPGSSGLESRFGAGEDAADSEPMIDLTGHHILLVDDVPANQMVAQTLLQRLGATVEVAENGAVALEKIEHAQAAHNRPGGFDVVLMDVSMPVMDGYECTRRIRARGLSRERFPVIGLTAHAFDEDIANCLAAGMNDFVPKPVRRRRLLPVLAKYLNLDVAKGVSRNGGGSEEATDASGSMRGGLDAATLRQLEDDVGTEAMPILLEQFSDEIERRVRAIARCVGAKDWIGAAAHAHALKSTAATFGAFGLRDRLVRIEKAGTRNDGNAALAAAAGLERLAESVQSAVARLQREDC